MNAKVQNMACRGKTEIKYKYARKSVGGMTVRTPEKQVIISRKSGAQDIAFKRISQCEKKNTIFVFQRLR